MDNRKNKAAHNKVRELTSHLEEEDLWDLEDSWDEEESVEPTDAEEKSVEEKTETPDLFADAAPEKEPEEAPVTEAEEEEAVETPVIEETLEEEPITEKVKNTYDDPEVTAEEAAKNAAMDLIKKAGLSVAEKIALGAVALIFVGLASWGYMFLHERNSLGNAEADLELPIKGKHVTISGFKTFWQNPGDAAGIKLGAQVIPAAHITLSEDSSGTGAFRLYFFNEEKDSVGDPITISFENGKFDNGEKSIEVSATDGFHEEGDFNAYVLDRDLGWRVQLLEADIATASGSDFKELFDTVVKPTRK